MSDKRAAGGVGPYGCEAVGLGAYPRDVEDAVPYGGVTIAWVRDCGRGKPLPYGDGHTRVRGLRAADSLPASDTQPGNGLRGNVTARS